MGIRFDGLSTGLNTTALIDSILGLERRPLDLAKARQADLSGDQDLYRQINTKLLKLREAALAIDNRNSLQTGGTLNEEFLSYAATSGDPSFFSVEATDGASPGKVDVRVNAIAQAGREISNGFADTTSVIAAAGQNIQITVGGVLLVDFTAGVTGASLNDILSAINSDPNNDGSVHSEILFDGTVNRLVVSSNRSGAANAVTITTNIDGPAGAGTPLFDATLSKPAQDSEVELFGVAVTRATNELTDVIPGVTIRLAQVHDINNPTQSTSVNVTRDDAKITAKVQAFVDAYNDVNGFMKDKSSYDPISQKGGPLIGDSTLQRLQVSLQRAMTDTYQVGTNPFSTFNQIGVNVDRNGVFSLDASKLTAALDQDPLAVREMLMGDGAPFTLDANGVQTNVEGAATSIGRMIEVLTRSGDSQDPVSQGIVFSRIQSYDPRIAALDSTIASTERRLAKRKELLVSQFSQLESLTASLRSQGSFLTSAFARSNNN